MSGMRINELDNEPEVAEETVDALADYTEGLTAHGPDSAQCQHLFAKYSHLPGFVELAEESRRLERQYRAPGPPVTHSPRTYPWRITGLLVVAVAVGWWLPRGQELGSFKPTVAEGPNATGGSAVARAETPRASTPEPVVHIVYVRDKDRTPLVSDKYTMLWDKSLDWTKGEAFTKVGSPGKWSAESLHVETTIPKLQAAALEPGKSVSALVTLEHLSKSNDAGTSAAATASLDVVAKQAPEAEVRQEAASLLLKLRDAKATPLPKP